MFFMKEDLMAMVSQVISSIKIKVTVMAIGNIWYIVSSINSRNGFDAKTKQSIKLVIANNKVSNPINNHFLSWSFILFFL